MSNLAPILLFVYNRPDHTRQTIEAIAANILAGESELFIYSDAPKNDAAMNSVQMVRSFIKTVHEFKSVTIIERDTNWGLAASIIDGVTEIVNRYGKVIVLEDDIVTSPYFLKYMNSALDFYKDEPKIWQINGYNYPIRTDGLGDVFISRFSLCWGWGTWEDRWKCFEKDADNLINTYSKNDIFHFNLDGATDLWNQVIANQTGEIDTWAIFWYAAIFQKNGLCLTPTVSFIKNIGFDGSGVHCGNTSYFFNDLSTKENLDLSKIMIEENKLAFMRVYRYLKKQNSISFRIMNKIKSIMR
jgi:hypothetical protein